MALEDATVDDDEKADATDFCSACDDIVALMMFLRCVPVPLDVASVVLPLCTVLELRTLMLPPIVDSSPPPAGEEVEETASLAVVLSLTNPRAALAASKFLLFDDMSYDL